jgi:hypothetical protein
MAKQWIAGTNMKEGKLTSKAKAKGLSLDAFCNQSGLFLQSKKECSLRKTLMGFKKK